MTAQKAEISDPEDVRKLLLNSYGDPGKSPISPHQRVDDTIHQRQPDQVPFDFWAVPEVWTSLKNYLNEASDEGILRLFGIDCRIVEPDYIGPKPRVLPDGTFKNILGSHRRKVSNEFSVYEEYASYPLAEARTKAEVENWPGWPKSSYWNWASVVSKIEKLNSDVQYYIRYDVGGIFESAWGLYGLDRFLTGLYDRQDVTCAIMDCYTDYMVDNVNHLMDQAKGLIDIVYTYDDIAIQNSLMMSRGMWRKFILPRHQRLNATIKKHGLKILYHSCGAIYPLISDLIQEMGIDVLNPLQPRAAGMDMARIKAEFGGQIAFHGGIDLQETMPFGSPDDVRHEVSERIRILGKGGSYICTTAHYIQADTPIENIIALYTAVRV